MPENIHETPNFWLCVLEYTSYVSWKTLLEAIKGTFISDRNYFYLIKVMLSGKKYKPSSPTPFLKGQARSEYISAGMFVV